MHDTGLDHRLRPDGFDSVGETLEPVTAHDQDVAYATVLQLRQDGEPELGAFTFRVTNPDAQDVFTALEINANSQIRRPVSDDPVTDLDHQSVDIDDRVHLVERPVPPLLELVEHRVGDFRDEIR